MIALEEGSDSQGTLPFDSKWLESVRCYIDKLRQKKDELALAAKKALPGSIECNKHARVEALLSQIDEEIKKFNKGPSYINEFDKYEAIYVFADNLNSVLNTIDANTNKILATPRPSVYSMLHMTATTSTKSLIDQFQIELKKILESLKSYLGKRQPLEVKKRTESAKIWAAYYLTAEEFKRFLPVPIIAHILSYMLSGHETGEELKEMNKTNEKLIERVIRNKTKQETEQTLFQNAEECLDDEAQSSIRLRK